VNTVVRAISHPVQPTVKEPLDLGGAEPIATLLQPGRIRTRGEPFASGVQPIPLLVACRFAHSWPVSQTLIEPKGARCAVAKSFAILLLLAVRVGQTSRTLCMPDSRFGFKVDGWGSPGRYSQLRLRLFSHDRI
jgi:hypothetical protein